MGRSRRAVIAFALIASLLVVAAQPAAASHQLVAVSANDTCSDFNAGTLTNLTTSGSGAACALTLSGSTLTIDDFEDGDVDEYSGDTGSVTVQSATVLEGSQTLRIDTSAASIFSTSGLGNYPSNDGNFSVLVRRSDSAAEPFVYFGLQAENSDNGYRIDIRNNDELELFVFNSGSATQLAAVGGVPDSAGTYRLEVNWTGSSIDITLFDTSDGGIETSLAVTNSSFSSGGIGFQRGGNGGDVFFDAVEDEGAWVSTPATYLGQNHTAEDTEQGFVNISELTNATVTVTWRTSDGGPWETLNQTSGITAAANHTFTWPVESNSTVSVNVTVQNQTGNGAPSFVMEHEGVQFAANGTFVDNASATPTGGLTTSTPTLEIDINDSDFPLAQGDSVDVEFRTSQDGLVGTVTLSSNGTASYTLTSSEALMGGQHTWNATAIDDYGHTVTSQDFSVSSPANITIRNVTEPHDVIKSCTAEIIISGNQSTVDIQEVTDGNITMTGLPLDESYVVIVNCEDYHQRAIPVEDIFEQADVFLLNTSVTSIENTFDVQDNTGSFPEPLFLIQRPINRSLYDDTAAEEYQWTTVGGDRISAAGTYVIDLEQDARYRLQVKDSGNVRVLGEYTAVNGGTVTLTIGQVTWPVQQGSARTFFTRKTIEDSGDWTIEVFYRDQGNVTDQLDVTVHERDNASNVLFTDSQSGPVVTYKATFTIPEADTDTTWNVSYDADLESGTSAGNEMLAGATIIQPPLDGNWLMAIFAAFIGVFAALSGSRDAGLFAVLVVILVGIAMAFQVVLINVAFYTVATLIALGGAARGWVNYP